MQIFSNQFLGVKPHLAVFSSSKVGNFVVTTPLLRGLKEKYPDCTIDFFGSEITQDFEIHCPYIDWRFSLYSHRPDFLEALALEVRQRREVAGDYDLAINCDAFSEVNLVMASAIRPTYIAGVALSRDFRDKVKFLDREDSIYQILEDNDWNSKEFVTRHKNLLKSNYISEIFCRIAYVETDFYQLELPTHQPRFSVPDVLIHVTATRQAKLWSTHYWQQVIQWCEAQGLTLGLVGCSLKQQQNLYNSGETEEYLLQTTNLIDLRGDTSLIELAGALLEAKVCITVDTGPLHIAAAVGCPTIAIFGNDIDGDGASPIRLWAPQQPHVKIAVSDFKCTLCQENQFKNHACLLDDHACMINLLPETVIEQLKELLFD